MYFFSLVLWRPKVFNFYEVQLPVWFSFTVSALFVLSKKLLPNPKLERFFSDDFFRSFVVVGFVLNFMIWFVLICIYVANYASNPLFSYRCPIGVSPFVRRTIIFPLSHLAYVCWKLISNIHVDIFLDYLFWSYDLHAYPYANIKLSGLLQI